MVDIDVMLAMKDHQMPSKKHSIHAWQPHVSNGFVTCSSHPPKLTPCRPPVLAHPLRPTEMTGFDIGKNPTRGGVGMAARCGRRGAEQGKAR